MWPMDVHQGQSSLEAETLINSRALSDWSFVINCSRPLNQIALN